MSNHQQVAYDQIQGNRPCCYRGELEQKIKHEPPTACCVAKDIVVKSKFFCKLYNQYLTEPTKCWLCTERKETVDGSGN